MAQPVTRHRVSQGSTKTAGRYPAGTRELETNTRSIGSAPDRSSFARFRAELIVKPPEICEPCEASIPSGYFV